MARRSSRSSSDEGNAGIAILFLIGASTLYRWAEALPGPWKLAAGILALSAVLLLAWALASIARRLYRRRLIGTELAQLSHVQFEERVKLLLLARPVRGAGEAAARRPRLDRA